MLLSDRATLHCVSAIVSAAECSAGPYVLNFGDIGAAPERALANK